MNATNLDKQVLQTVGAEQRWKTSTNLINLAPGIKDDSAMGAASRVSNQWQIDGQSLLTFVGSGADWNYPDLDIVEEAQVSGSGANAEYGNFTGRVLNLITKSGGNAFEGLISTTYSPLPWSQKNFNVSEDKFSLFGAPPRQLFFDAHVGIGGPIVRDRLWFYVSGGFIQGDTEYIKNEPRESEQIPKGFGKLTWQPNRNDRLSFFVEYEFFQVFNRGYSVQRPLGHLLHVAPTRRLTAPTFTRTPSPSQSLLLQPLHQRPSSARPPALHTYDSTAATTITGDPTNHLTGTNLSHHEEMSSKAPTISRSASNTATASTTVASPTRRVQLLHNVPIYSYSDYQYHYYNYAYSYSYDLKSNGWRLSAFAQDSWKIGDRLTINPGVRWQMQRSYLPNVQDGAIFKPKSALSSGWADLRCLQRPHDRPEGPLRTVPRVVQDLLLQHRRQQLQRLVQYWIQPTGPRSSLPSGLLQPTTVDPKARIPYSDQLTFGLERSIMKNASLGSRSPTVCSRTS